MYWQSSLVRRSHVRVRVLNQWGDRRDLSASINCLNMEIYSKVFLVLLLITTFQDTLELTTPSDVSAINNLYAALGSPVLPGWTITGGDPCAEAWQGVQCINTDIISITLIDANLGGELGDDLGSFSSIRSIDLSNNHIGGSIPANLPVTLQNFFLADNQFTGSIPSSLSSLTQLSAMSLNINQLSGEIPDSFEGLTLLVNLDLSSNNLSEHLPPSMGSLLSLNTLNLQNNQISGTLDVLQDLPLLTLNVENNLFNGPIPDKLSSIPNFLKDGNPLNTTSPSSAPTSPTKPPKLEPSLPFWGTPSSNLTPDKQSPGKQMPGKQAPPKQADGPKTMKGPDSISNAKNSVTTKRTVWISIASVLSCIILLLAILLLAQICGNRRRDDERISRHGIAPYIGSRDYPTDDGTVIQKSYYSEKVPSPKVVAAKSEEKEQMVKRRMSWTPKVKEQELSDDHGIDLNRSDIELLAPPPPPPLLKEEKTDSRRLGWISKMRNQPEINAQRTRAVPKSDDHEIDMTIFDVDSLAPPPQVPPARSLKSLISAKSYSIASLQLYTNSFSQENLIGRGMLGSVYRAELPSGKLLAVKKLDKRVFSQQKDEEFIDLVNNIAKFHHANVVKLMGYCAEHGERLLIYEYCDCGTLQDILHSEDELKKELSWNTRIRLALAAARALEYLHEVCEPPVIHRNFKSSNILLDGELDAHVSDCGFAHLISDGAVRQLSGQLLSNCGYGAPEFETGVYTIKSDVYCFGVVMLELVTGRKSYDRTQNRGEQCLARWATHQLHDINALSKMVDPTLNGEYPAKSLSRFADIISRCIQMEPEFRPLMSEVVQDIIQMIRRDSQ